MEESTFACQLTSPELQKRKASIIRELKGIIHSKKELDSGYSYTFSNSNAVLDLIFDFVKSERLCCLFFNFQINVNPNSVILKVTGKPGVKEFLVTELDL